VGSFFVSSLVIFFYSVALLFFVLTLFFSDFVFHCFSFVLCFVAFCSVALLLFFTAFLFCSSCLSLFCFVFQALAAKASLVRLPAAEFVHTFTRRYLIELSTEL